MATGINRFPAQTSEPGAHFTTSIERLQAKAGVSAFAMRRIALLVTLAAGCAGADEESFRTRGQALVPGNLIVNGDFEFPVIGQDCTDIRGWCYVPGTLPSLGWQVEWANEPGSVGNLELQRGILEGPVTGLQYAELDSHGRVGSDDNNIRLFQTLHTCPGAEYTLRYFWKPRPRVTAIQQQLSVWWGGAIIARHLDEDNPWTLESWSLNGAYGPQRLELVSEGLGDTLGMFIDDVSVVGPDARTANACVAIDVKPGSLENPINLASRGSIPVTIWGSESFDVTALAPEALRLAGAPVHKRGKSGTYQCALEDRGSPESGEAGVMVGLPDGFMDLTCHFDTQALDLAAGATAISLSMTACEGGLEQGCAGKLSTELQATDRIRIVPDCPQKNP